MKKRTVLISACLLGVPCRYDGGEKIHPLAPMLAQGCHLLPVCPEQLGGLPTPRTPAERRGERVVTRDGRDVTAAYRRGAQAALRLCRLCGCETAVLKARSPSCGCGRIYDGSFSGALIPGDGVAAALLKENGVCVMTEEDEDGLRALLRGDGEGRPKAGH